MFSGKVNFSQNQRGKKGARQSVAVGCSFWQLLDHCDAEGHVLLRRDGEAGGREGEREQNVLFLLAEERSATLEAVLCRGPYILVPGTRASGGWECAWEGWGGGGGVVSMLLWSQPKSRTRLMGSPLLCDPSLENWSRHPDSCLPSSAYRDGAWRVDGGGGRDEG